MWVSRSSRLFFVVPGTIRRAAFHGGKDMHKTRMISAFFDELFNPHFFSKRFVRANKFKFDSLLLDEMLDIEAQFFTQFVPSFRVIVNEDIVVAEVFRHCVGVADIRQGACYDHTVKTRESAGNETLMVFYKRIHDEPPG